MPRPLNIGIVGPSTLSGRVLCNYFLNKPNTRVTAINFTTSDKFHSKWGLSHKRYHEILDLQFMDKSGLGLSSTKTKIDVIINAGAGLQVFVPNNWKYMLKHPLTWLLNFDIAAIRPIRLSEGYWVQERLINSHTEAADTTRRVIHRTLYEDQPDLYILNSSHQYYDDDMDNRLIKEVANFQSEGNQNKMWINKIWANIEAAGDLGNKVADAGYERHDILELERFDKIREQLVIERDELLSERNRALELESSSSPPHEKNDDTESLATDAETRPAKSKIATLKQSDSDIDYNQKLDHLEDQITYYQSLDHNSTSEPNSFFPARMVGTENLPDPELFKDSQSVTRQVTLRSGVILTEPNVNGSLNEYYYMKKRGVVTGAKMNWIHQEDFCRLVNFCIINNDVEGVLNAVSPADVSHGEYVQAFRKHMILKGKPESYYTTRLYHRYAQDVFDSFLFGKSLKWHGYFGIKATYGTHIAQYLFYSPNTIPSRVINYGFNYKFANLDVALKDLSKNLSVLKSLKRFVATLAAFRRDHGVTFADSLKEAYRKVDERSKRKDWIWHAQHQTYDHRQGTYHTVRNKPRHFGSEDAGKSSE